MTGLLFIALTTGCSGAEDDSAASSHADHEHDAAQLPADFDPATERTTHGGTVTVSYTSDPSPIPESTLFALTFSTSAGAVVTAADATMPNHGGHGMTVEPELTDNGDGTFTAAPFEFHMPGYWVIHATVADTNGTEERADFDVACCD